MPGCHAPQQRRAAPGSHCRRAVAQGLCRRASYGHLGSVPKGDTKALARLIEERTRPLHGGLRTGFAARLDAVFSRLMTIALPSRFQA
jgi:hypothetical protein